MVCWEPCLLDYNEETCQGKFTVLLGDISSGIALQGSVPEKSGLPRHANLNDRKRLARSRDSTQMFQMTSKRGSVIVRWFSVLCPRFQSLHREPEGVHKIGFTSGRRLSTQLLESIGPLAMFA